MRVTNEKLEKFSNSIFNDVNKKAKEILDNAQKTYDDILEKAKDEALNIAYEMIQENNNKITSKYKKIVSKAEIEARKEVLSHREELSQLIFANVKAKLNTFTLSDKYENYLVNVLKESLSNVDTKEGIEIFLSPKDMKFKDKLVGASNFKDVKISENQNIKLGGLEILFVGSNIIDDKTFDSALLEQKEIFNQSSKLKIEM